MSGSPFDVCKGYISALAAEIPPRRKPDKRPPSVTISRETGAGAITVARRLAEILEKSHPHHVPWTVFNRNLVEQVIADHELPAALGKFMPEDVKSGLTDAVEEMLGLHPSTWTLVEQTTDTILRLATAGRVIIVGRGGAVITAHLKNTLHVRLVAPMEFRVKHMEEYSNLTEHEAAIYVKIHDKARARYVSRNFDADIADPLRYHLTINTAKTGFENAAHIIAGGVRNLIPETP
jgi:cytidylate kinase